VKVIASSIADVQAIDASFAALSSEFVSQPNPTSPPHAPLRLRVMGLRRNL
jgi:hypothetical protein